MSTGDVLVVSRGPYSHAGVDMGDGTVIHFTGEGVSKAGARVQRTSMEEFLAGDEIISVRRSSEPAQVLTRATSMLGQGSYDLILNNCQHFAEWCLTGAREGGEEKLPLGVVAWPVAAAATFAAILVLPPAIFGYGAAQLLSTLARIVDARSP